MTFQLSDATRALFAKEVAKYPADQKQSAVMACLAIVQHEEGWVPSTTCTTSRSRVASS
jgi:NADH-quinone oxidoreductase subunit E